MYFKNASRSCQDHLEFSTENIFETNVLNIEVPSIKRHFKSKLFEIIGKFWPGWIDQLYSREL